MTGNPERTPHVEQPENDSNPPIDILDINTDMDQLVESMSHLLNDPKLKEPLRGFVSGALDSSGVNSLALTLNRYTGLRDRMMVNVVMDKPFDYSHNSTGENTENNPNSDHLSVMDLFEDFIEIQHEAGSLTYSGLYFMTMEKPTSEDVRIRLMGDLTPIDIELFGIPHDPDEYKFDYAIVAIKGDTPDQET